MEVKIWQEWKGKDSNVNEAKKNAENKLTEPETTRERGSSDPNKYDEYQNILRELLTKHERKEIPREAREGMSKKSTLPPIKKDRRKRGKNKD